MELGIQYHDKRHEIIGEMYNRKDLISQTASMYPLAIDICQKMHAITGDLIWISKIFDYAEESKAFQLREILKAEKAARFADVPDSLIDLEKNSLKKFKPIMMMPCMEHMMKKKTGNLSIGSMNMID